MLPLRSSQDIQRLIPRAEMDALKVELQETVRSVDPAFECEVLGSYRRGVPFSSDIDLAVRHPSFNGGADEEAKGKAMLESIIGQLEAKGLVKKENELMRGNKKYAVRDFPSVSASSRQIAILRSALFPGSDPAPPTQSLPPHRRSTRTLCFLPVHAPRLERRLASDEAAPLAS